MKKIYLIAFIFLTSLTFSQVVFCPPGATWKGLYTVNMWRPEANENTGIYYIGDQLIGGETAKVLSHNKFYGSCNFNNTQTLILQRGDTIFMKNDKTNNSWEILFNYAATAGQSWKTTYKVDGGDTRTYSITVDSTGYISINNKNLKQLFVHCTYFHSNTQFTFTTTIRERMGWGFLFTYDNNSGGCDGDFFIQDLCYSDNEFGLHKYSNLSCNYENPVGLAEIESTSSALKIFPNPVGEVLNMQITDEHVNNTTISVITDMYSQNIKTFIVRDKITVIKLDGLNPGIYFLQLLKNGVQICITKLVKL